MGSSNFYVDTCVLGDILKQYDGLNSSKALVGSKFLKPSIKKILNIAIESDGDYGMIFTSSFSFVELINKFTEIFKESSFSIDKLNAFLKQPPGWITIEDMGEELTNWLRLVPLMTTEGEAISGDDAIHIATAMSRQDEIIFCTSDLRLAQLDIDKIIFLSQ